MPSVFVHRERCPRGVTDTEREDPYVCKLDNGLDPSFRLCAFPAYGACTNANRRLKLEQIVLVSVKGPSGAVW